jgi:AmmeMemoRadiSam system protein B
MDRLALPCPRLRPGLAAYPDDRNPRYVILHDQLRLTPSLHRLTIVEFGWVQLFDGRRTLHEIQLIAMQQQGGQVLPLELFVKLIDQLDDAFLLDTPRYRERLQSPIREPSCLGCYEAEPAALRRQLTGLFSGPRGPGLPAAGPPTGRLRAALLPHVDYARGGSCFAWGFKELFEQADASLFIIVGTSHYSGHRFTLTRQDFRTPLGIARTDQDFIDRLVKHYGDGLFDDPLAHVPEHSIELEVVFLQFLYEARRDIRIVPLVVGSFADCVESGQSPAETEDIGRMIRALRRAEAETSEPICWIISGDLAHLGPKFGDLRPVDQSQLDHCRQQDSLLMKQSEAADPAGYFGVIAAERDARRICGLPPTYTVLEAVRPRNGKLLNYDQYIHPRGFESLSFASVGFYR